VDLRAKTSKEVGEASDKNSNRKNQRTVEGDVTTNVIAKLAR
jgi:hypothetical protein